jgi:quinol-cytochrome oxidoreductase complex cytochrome b subunit
MVRVRFQNFDGGHHDKNPHESVRRGIFGPNSMTSTSSTGSTTAPATRASSRAALYEHIPGGARWRYVWGSTLMFAFSVQMVTGLFLWMHYSPSSQTAWESVYYIQHEMTGGWLLRGIHHYTAQVMIILLALHMLQVIIDGAYRAPREFNFWIGLVLLNLVLGALAHGYLLPWDQRGLLVHQRRHQHHGRRAGAWAGLSAGRRRAGVRAPHAHALLRVHAGLLPFLMMVFIAVHVYLFRRTACATRSPSAGRTRILGRPGAEGRRRVPRRAAGRAAAVVQARLVRRRVR